MPRVSGGAVQPRPDGELRSIPLDLHIGLCARPGSARLQQRNAPNGDVFHIYSITVPHDGWQIGVGNISDHQHICRVESYEEPPPWGEHVWKEVCAGGEQDAALVLTPDFTDGECSEFLELISPALSETCCAGEGLGDDCFAQHLALHSAPAECGVDCAHSFFAYAEDCGHFLTQTHPGLAGFTGQCAAMHSEMEVLSLDDHLEEGQTHEHGFDGEQGLIYDVVEELGTGIDRSELSVRAAGTHHVLADRLDVSKQGAGEKFIEYDSVQSLPISAAITALEGSGDVHVSVQPSARWGSSREMW